MATIFNTSSHPIHCFHCGLEAIPAFDAVINDEPKHFCCLGCQAVAQSIVEGGLAGFYHYRDKQNIRPEQGLERFDAYDLASVQEQFVFELSSDERRVKLIVGGIRCAACAWLIEHYLEQIVGVSHVHVNVSNHICSFDWAPDQSKLSAIFAALHRIGYRPQPGTDEQTQIQRQREQRTALLRIGVAGLGMMQVGMVAVALHAGNIQGIDANWQHFLRWVSLIFAIPVMFFSAQPFFVSAVRTLKLKHLNMDVPVSLALLLAFTASVFGTVTNTGEVYFDSVSMFTFFLLVGRYLEMRARHTNQFESENLSQLLPLSAERIVDQSRELIPLSSVENGDRIRIAAGDIIPVDGILDSSMVLVNESLLTGESEPIEKQTGDMVFAGSILGEPAAEITVSATGNATRLAAVQQLVNDAMRQKPKQQLFADNLARYFVAGVLLCFVCVYCVWLYIDSSRAFWVALSVLVVTCPCALSLATPAALAAGLNRLRRNGFLVVASNALEVLPSIDHIVFDKTGTLTLGEPSVINIVKLCDKTDTDIIEIVASLEHHSRHPFALAFKDIKTSLMATNIKIHPGLGIEGCINSKRYRFGRSEFACVKYMHSYPSEGAWQLLSQEGIALAWIQFGDQARPDIAHVLREFTRKGISISLMSGDRQANVDMFVARYLNNVDITVAKGDLLPEDKLSYLVRLQQQGRRVMMVGDGINDVPVLSAADLSVAMGSASRMAKVNAGTVLLNQKLPTLLDAMRSAKYVNTIIRQNFAWALGYNLLALPAAAMGIIPPYLAAAGMSLSSLVVVLNSLRLGRAQT